MAEATTTPPAAAQTAAPAKQAATTTPPPAAAPAKQPASVKMPESLGNRLRGGPKPMTPEEKAAKEEEDKKAAAEAQKKEEEEKAKAAAAAGTTATDGDEGKKVTPAKRVIRKAAGYEGAPGVEDATKKLAAAADKLADAATKVGAVAPAAAPQEPELDKKEQRKLKVLEAMAEMDPERFKALPGNAKKYLAELPKNESEWTNEFKTNWERKNPASRFDDDDDRQQAFDDALEAARLKFIDELKTKYGVDYDEDDFIDGVNYLRDKPIKEQLGKTEAELQRLRAEKDAREAEAAAKEVAPSAVADIVSQAETGLGEEFKGVLTEDGAIDEKAFANVKDGKYIKPFIENAVKDSGAFAEAAVRVERGLPTPNEGRVLFAISEYEREMIAKPEDERLIEVEENGGKVVKRFATIADFREMKPADRRAHYTVDSDALILYVNQKLLEIAKRQIEIKRAEIEEWRKENGGTVAQAAAATAQPAASARAAKPQSPAVTAGSTPTGTTAPTPGGLFRKRFGGG